MRALTRHMSVVMLASTLFACPSGDDQATPDGAISDANSDAPPGCTRPSLDTPDLRTYVKDVVAQLAATPRSLNTQRSSARTLLMNKLSAIGWQPQLHSYATGANVVATVPATMGSGKLIVLGAHFDSFGSSPGANDNATGVAVVLAVARYLKD